MGENENNIVNDKNVEVKPNITDDYTYDLSKIVTDERSARIISPAYAGRNSELTAILQYVYQTTIFDSIGQSNIAKTLHHISLDEMDHLNLLARTLVKLGVAPIYTLYPPQRDLFFTSRYINYCTNPKQMIECAIHGEEVAIKEYTNMLNLLQNTEVKKVISYILEQEKKHLEQLRQIQQNM